MKLSISKSFVTVVVLCSLAFAASAVATLPPGPKPTAPVRSTYQDVSLKLLRTSWGAQYPYMYMKGRVATQVGRDDMEATLTALAVPEAYRFARSTKVCAGSMTRIVSLFNNITAKLGPGYEFKSIFPHGTWFIPASGRHYSDERYALKSVRDCALSGGGKECGTNKLMTANLRDLLDLNLVNGACVANATFAITSPLEAYSNYRADDGIIQAKTLQPPLTAKQTVLIMAAHAAHSAVSKFRCGGPATTANVAAAHMALEATATNEDMHRFLRMKNFSGAVDPLWTSAEVCKLAKLQDVAHARWMVAVQRGDWAHAREADNDHQLAHIMMGMKDANLRILLSCGQYIFNCGVKTEAQILATL